MNIIKTTCRGRYERTSIVAQTITTLDELLEYAFLKKFIRCEDWRGWHPLVQVRAQQILDLPECGATEVDLKIRFDILNPNRTARPNNVEYWINRGWTETDAIVHIKSNQRTRNAKKQETKTIEYWVRAGKTIQEAQQAADDAKFGGTPRRLEYWVKRGATVDEAVKKVSQHQSECSPKVDAILG